MATKAMNLNPGLEAADAGQDERHNSRSLAGRQPGVCSHCSASATRRNFLRLMTHKKCSAGSAVTAGMERCSTSLNHFTFRLRLQRSRF